MSKFKNNNNEYADVKLEETAPDIQGIAFSIIDDKPKSHYANIARRNNKLSRKRKKKVSNTNNSDKQSITKSIINNLPAGNFNSVLENILLEQVNNTIRKGVEALIGTIIDYRDSHNIDTKKRLLFRYSYDNNSNALYEMTALTNSLIKWISENTVLDKRIKTEMFLVVDSNPNNYVYTTNTSLRNMNIDFKYKGHLFHMSYEKDTESDSDIKYQNEYFVIEYEMEDRYLVDEMIMLSVKEMHKDFEKDKYTKIITSDSPMGRNTRYEFSIKYLDRRRLDTVYLKKGISELLINSINAFIEKAEFYKSKGIIHKYNILLSGEPRTGKTSIIRAIAGEFKKDIFLLDPLMIDAQIDDENIYKKSIVVIEDIDSNSSIHKRDKYKDNTKSNTSSEFKHENLSKILNILDGVMNSGGILIATTNDINILDPAILGRFNLKLDIGYIDNYQLENFLVSILELDRSIVIKKMKDKQVNDNITISAVQDFILNKGIEDIDKVISEFMH